MADFVPSPQIESAFREYEREIRIHNYRVACILAMVFMPAGGFLDHFVLRETYPRLIGPFFLLRLLCSGLLLLIWWLVRTPFGTRHHIAFGQIVAALPSFTISLMIFATDGARSSYYAGINLVLLGAGLVLRWTLRDSIMVTLSALIMYIAACIGHAASHGTGLLWLNGNPNPDFFNNLYFLLVTVVFVVIGNYFYNLIRFREFALRYELDRNRRELEKSNQKLLELDEAKSRFFANISHELRTPLTLLIAPIETLLHRKDLAEDLRRMLDTMHGNAMRLLKLINDLLELVRLESGSITVRRDTVQLEPFLRGIANAARQVAEDKRLHLSFEIDPNLGPVITDRDKLEKIILNLTFNALKFTPAGGKVQIAAARSENSLLITVSDTGMGIAQKNIPFIFDRFWQVDGSSKRKYQGAGIGLALVKEFATVQGGSVDVTSTEGKGTTFSVRLPFEPAPANSPQPAPEITEKIEPATDVEPAAHGPGPGPNTEDWLQNLYRRAELFPALSPVRTAIRPVEHTANSSIPTLLIADDEPDMLAFLKSQLSADYNIVEAVDGEQAIEKASHFLPDIILLDMMMPEKDGLQVCREIRELVPTQNIPVILLTARADDETKMKALDAGASDFLAKPFSTAELRARIRNLIERQSFQRQLSRQNQALEFTNHRLRDTIDQLKHTELQLIQTEKLASLGRMSAGIIHEINNPLNFANSGLMVLRKKTDKVSEDYRADYIDVLKDIEDGIGRIQSIVTDLRTFSYRDTGSHTPVLVEEAVRFALRFLSHELKDLPEARVDLVPELRVMANKNLLVQVLVNLIKNAIDAVKAKRYDAAESPMIKIATATHPGTLTITIRDNGCGIQPQHLDKIFDPFFTTKDQGQGMGLGLSLCHSILQSFNAKITVNTEAGRFSEFVLAFPNIAEPAAHPRKGASLAHATA